VETGLDFAVVCVFVSAEDELEVSSEESDDEEELMSVHDAKAKAQKAKRKI